MMTLKFGWGWAQHSAIQQTATQLVPTTALKQFLAKHQKTIDDVSIDQDKNHSGPNHFINLEIFGTGQKAHGTTVQKAKFPWFANLFSPQNKQQKAQDFQNKPLTTHALCSEPNVFKALMDNYQNLVGQFKTLAASPPTDAASGQTVGQAIAETIGRMSHYAGDLTQPMHASIYYNWIKHDNAKAHSFMERSLFKNKHLKPWQQSVVQSAPTIQAKPQTDLEYHEARQIEKSHLTLFDLIKIDDDSRNNATSFKSYNMRLSPKWRKIGEERMQAAAVDIATLLESAYTQAGRPDLSALA